MKVVMRFKLMYTCLPQPVIMPYGSKILNLTEEEGFPVIWAEADEQPNGGEFEKRTFRMFDTSESIPNEFCSYIGSVTRTSRTWHFYEKN